MRKVWLVARHEFSVTIGRLSYRIFAAAVPVLALVALIAIAVFQAVNDGSDGGLPAEADVLVSESVSVGYVDLTAAAGNGGPLFAGSREQDDATFTPFLDQAAAMRAAQQGRISRLFVFPPDYLQTGVVLEIEGPGLSDRGQTSELREFIVENLVAAQVSPERVERLVRPYLLTTVQVDESGVPTTKDEGADGAFTTSLFFMAAGMLLLVSIFTASGYLLQGLSEEKENRIMEVLLSTMKPEHLMFGKLIGLGAAGLLQMAVWSAAGIVFALAVGLLFVDFPEGIRVAPAPADILIALAYFFLGYAFFGTLQAAIGAITTNAREAGNITAFVMVLAVAPLWVLPAIIQQPAGTLARVLSFVPFTAPITSLIRLTMGEMSVLDLALSLGVLALSVALIVWLTTKLFRAYLLMYGQRPRIGDLLRTLRGA